MIPDRAAFLQDERVGQRLRHGRRPPGAARPAGRAAASSDEICARGTGVGADGIVFLEPSDVGRDSADLSERRRDPGRLLRQRDPVHDPPGHGAGDRFAQGARRSRRTTAWSRRGSTIRGRRSTFSRCPRSARAPPIFQPRRGERRIGFAKVGVPHLVILCDDVATVDVVGRGRPLRHHPKLAEGANVNFVSRNRYGRWKIRTYERGVEAETLACGSGSVATAILLTAWNEAAGDIELETKSGRVLRVRLRREGERWFPSLSGEARVVFEGRLSEI